VIPQSGNLDKVVIEFRPQNGRLHGTMSDLADPGANPDEGGGAHLGLAFYRPDYGLDLGPDGEPTGTRSDFVRGSDGNIAWFRNHGRLYQKQ